MLRYITGVYMLVSALNEMTVSAQNCTTGWFGFNCLLKCHCNNSQSCAMDGQCASNDSCGTGYFGPACQYAIANLTSPTPQYLLDNSNKSCNVDRFATFVELTLVAPISFSWYRVEVDFSQTILDINTKLNNDTPCHDERKYRVSDNVLDVMCRTNQLVKTVKITGHIASSICSVYISAGRNLALKQETYQTSNYSTNSSFQAKNAVDGNTNADINSGSCSHSAAEGSGPEWYLTYFRPMVLYAVRVYNRNAQRNRLRGFSLTTYSEARTVTNNLTAPFQSLAVYDLTLPSQSPVTILRIKGSTAIPTNERILNICEVETYGDSACSEDFYGLFCQGVCNCSKNDVCSPILGVCTQGCPRGHYGSGCVNTCSDKCLDGYCKFVSGKCIQCVPGFIGDFCTEECSAGSYGISCASNCSKHCITNCNPQTGNCTCEAPFTGTRCEECNPGLYDHSCNLTCSGNCKQKLCNKTSGHCVQCNGDRRFGNFCEECPLSHYGALCDLRCPEACLNNTCEADSGHCFSCDPGLTGKDCTEIANKITWIDRLPLLLPFIIAWPCCLWFCLYRTKNKTSVHKE